MILVGTFIYFGYPIWKATRTTKAIIVENAVSYQQHPTSPNITVLVAGDSTGVGTGAGDAKYSTAGRLGNEFPRADITNISKNGLKLEGLQKKLELLPDESHYDLILLQIGANDVIGLTSQKKIKERLASVLKNATDHSNRVIVITSGNIGLAPVFKMPLSTYISYRTRIVRTLFIDQINLYPEVRYVDLYKNSEDDIFITDIDKYYAADYFHPSKDAYALWYEEIQKVLSSE